jgi:thiol-disulfide isomerase/thioredoxin
LPRDPQHALIIIDVFSDWCGPTTMLHRTLKNLFYELGEQHNIKFCEANADFIALLKSDKDKLGCKPLWLFYKDGSEVGRIEGADVPKIEKIIRANAPKKIGT